MPDLAPAPSRLARLRRAAVVGVVLLHLLLFPIRNLLDLGGREIYPWLAARGLGPTVGRAVEEADRYTGRYCNLVGCEQDWRMFGAPIDRHTSFTAWRVELSDGSQVAVPCPREPADPEAFFRVGDWQMRKLEDYLLQPPPQRSASGEWPLWAAAARSRAETWRRDHPRDPRSVTRVVLVRRRYHLPPPERQPAAPDITAEDLLAFGPDGGLLP